MQKELRELSLKDTLTRLYNRRYLEEYTESIVSGVMRRETSLAVLICDLDLFKQVNDVYGHDCGDIVLREISNVLRNNIRKSDILIRYGGEEFLIILMDIEGNSQSLVIAEKIRASVEGTKINIGGSYIKKTLSIGVSELPGDSADFNEVIKFADIALYDAKKTGRNKVVKFSMIMNT
ncbi:MAG: GGDEF domain-containing protein [Candidatus Magnetoovum sp. WYHC-5]|nr:GGDEF domain-containing protein [Candidatus Magnetoovum sp. WYHC-5]